MREYKEVRVKDLFGIRRGEGLPKHERIEGKTPLITAAKYRNGVVDYIDAESCGMTVFKGGVITINCYGMAFFHDYDCCADNHNCVLTNGLMSDSAKLYIAGVIDKTTKGKYQFFKEFRIKDAERLMIKLPVDECGNIDFNYMENYIKSLQTEIFANAA